jgi:hypothetical protein
MGHIIDVANAPFLFAFRLYLVLRVLNNIGRSEFMLLDNHKLAEELTEIVEKVYTHDVKKLVAILFYGIAIIYILQRIQIYTVLTQN